MYGITIDSPISIYIRHAENHIQIGFFLARFGIAVETIIHLEIGGDVVNERDAQALFGSQNDGVVAKALIQFPLQR